MSVPVANNNNPSSPVGVTMTGMELPIQESEDDHFAYGGRNYPLKDWDEFELYEKCISYMLYPRSYMRPLPNPTPAQKRRFELFKEKEDITGAIGDARRLKEHFEEIKEVLETEKEDALADRTAACDEMIKVDNIRAKEWEERQEKKRREQDQN